MKISYGSILYYLNHVGYKGISVLGTLLIVARYYLNHVGYKVVGLKEKKGRGNIRYYLNHVGYKV